MPVCPRDGNPPPGSSFQIGPGLEWMSDRAEREARRETATESEQADPLADRQFPRVQGQGERNGCTGRVAEPPLRADDAPPEAAGAPLLDDGSVECEVGLVQRHQVERVEAPTGLAEGG